jgi:NADH-quinone oxidoreductase subunit N
MTDLSIDFGRLLPALVPIGGVVVILLLDLVSPRLRRLPYTVALVASLGAAAATVPGLRLGAGESLSTVCVSSPGGLGAIEGLPRTCFWQAGSLGSTLQLAAALAAALTIVLAWPWSGEAASPPHGTRPGHPATQPRSDTPAAAGAVSHREPIEAVLLLTALTGAVVVAASRDVGTWLIGLELATLPIIGLIALSGTRSAIAGAMQLLTTSLVSFAILVLGVALWFAASGSPFLTVDAALRAEAASGAAGWGVLALAVTLIITGLGFKLSLVPFHAWTPTAYAGSRTAVAAFLATVSKIAALGALLVVLQALTAIGTSVLVVIAVLAVASMTVGNVMALRQDNVVLLLAWSTVAQAGWVVLPLVSLSTGGDRAAATYLLTYVIATLVAFAVVGITVRELPAQGRTLAAYTGLWQRSPWRAGALALALTSLAGLPPGVIGLVGKVVALRPVVSEGWVWLALLAAANAVLGVAVYTRWLRPVITSGTPEGALAPELAHRPGVPESAGELEPAGVLARSSEAASGTEVPAGSVAPGRRPGVAGRRRVRMHQPVDRVALMFALVVASVLLVAVSVQPDLLLGLLG